jgi:hypothetical protein
MGALEAVVFALDLGGVAGGIYLLVRAFRIPQDRPLARFESGWLGVFGLTLGLGSFASLAALLVQCGGGSWVSVAAAIALNLVVQPFALLFCWTAIRKITLGLRGQVAYAWVRIPEEDLAKESPESRRQLSRFCVMQGVVVLPVGAAVSFACASPLLGLFGLGQ